ncbi:MAG TPA: alpha/beta fold hydrolase, partial [Steroidobacteraceae bacterium]
MNCRNYRLSCVDVAGLFCYEWTDSPPRAIVQIVHGAFEHAARYAHFACALVARGFAVVAEDHRGHGRTAATVVELGHMGPANAIERVADDVVRLTLESRAVFPGLPAILFGHSLGSLISQRVLAKHGRLYDAAVLSGSLAIDDLIQTKPAIDEATSRHGRDSPAEQLHASFLSELVQDIDSPRTQFDWLSRDSIEV